MIYTRITTRSMDSNLIQNLIMNRAKLNDLQEQISTGKKVNRPSDDPNGTMNILSAKTSLSQIDRYIQNIDYANSELDVAEKGISNAIEIIHKAKDLASKASNATNGETEISAINSELEQLIASVKDIANTKFGNKYIFGGLVTESAPFTQDASGNIVYNGTPSTGNYQREAEIGDGVKVQMNLAGDTIFGQYDPDNGHQSGLFNTLKTLSEQLKTVPVDYEAIRPKIDELNGNLTDLINAQSSIGGITSRLDMTKNKLEEDSITFESFRSSSEDVDLAKVVTDYKFQETALQASLQVGARVIQPSLLNYLSM